MTDPDLERKLREALLQTFFKDRPTGFPETEAERKDLEDHISRRYEECEQIVLPWVSRRIDLSTAEVLEIGCGTGSSTASFAGRARHVYAYDIIERSVAAARERLRLLGISNASCFFASPGELLDQVEANHPDGVDLVLLYAVMEHQTIDERLATLERCWERLRPGGHLVVTDSPNRLCYKHYHTSEIPFFDMVPPTLALRQVGRSPRAAFRDSMQRVLAASPDQAFEVLTRWGTGISHHEFESIMGDLRELVVGDGFDSEILSRKPIVIEEELLLSHFVMTSQPIPLGFARVSVDVILRKPDGSSRPFFRSEGERYVDQIRRRFATPLGADDLTAEDAAEPAPVSFERARRVAEESLNGRTLLRMALRKLGRKLVGRAER